MHLWSRPSQVSTPPVTAPALTGSGRRTASTPSSWRPRPSSTTWRGSATWNSWEGCWTAKAMELLCLKVTRLLSLSWDHPREYFRFSLHGRHLPGRHPPDREGRGDPAEEEVVGGGAGRRLLQGCRRSQQWPDGGGRPGRSLYDAHRGHRLRRHHRRLWVHLEETEAGCGRECEFWGEIFFHFNLIFYFRPQYGWKCSKPLSLQ